MTRMQRVVRWLWAGLMLALPVTSFPPISRIFGVQSVAALSVVFLAIIFVLWFIPFLWRGGRLPLSSIPLLFFVLAALIASFGSFFLPVPSFRDASRWGTILENLITLGIGISAYLMAASWPKEKTDFTLLFRWLNYGGIILIIWSGIQAYYGVKYGGYTSWMESLQPIISSSGLLYYKRVTGLAFEPSWLAHQLNMIYLPWWLAASLHRTSAHHIRFFRLSLENILLIGGVGTLFFSYSRVGWLAFLMIIAFLILDLSLKLVATVQSSIVRRWKHPSLKLAGKTVLPLLLTICLLAVYLGMFLGAGFGLSRLDPRMEQLFDIRTLRDEGLMMFANRLVFAERIVFWQTGYEIFNDFPVLGVGIGNSGYFFPEKMDDFGYGLTEVRQLLYENPGIPNTKALWSRLAAETGLIGLSLFFTWLIVLWVSSRPLGRSSDRLLNTIGYFGLFVLVGLLVEGFSVDTFALPYFWLSLGILSAGFKFWASQEQPQPESI